MNGMLSEPILLLIIAILFGNLTSSLLYPNPTAGLQTAQNWYDLTTKWQNLRFALETQTVESIVNQIQHPDCAIPQNFQPVFDLPAIFSDATNVFCTATNVTVTQNQTDVAVTVTISCTQNAAEGFGATFEQTVLYEKQVISQDNGTSCDITIIDLESGQLDYTNQPPGPFAWTIVNQSPIEQFASTPISVFYENLTGLNPPSIQSLDCGNNIGTIIGTCDNPTSGMCQAQCGPYDTSGSFTINATLDDDGTTVNAVPDTVTVNPAEFLVPLRGHWNFDEKNLSNQYKNLLTDAYDLQSNNTIDTRFGPLDTNHSVYFKGSDDSYLKSTNNLDLADTDFSISLWMNSRYFLGGSQTLFSLCPSEQTGECLRLIYEPYSRNIIFDIWGGNLNAQSTNVFDGQWHHIVITHKQISNPNCYEQPAAQREIFIDKILVKSDNIANDECSNRFVGPPSSFCLGTRCRPDGTQTETFNGKIEDVWVFEGILTATEIQSLYDKSALQAPSGNPITEWLFEDALTTEQWQDQTPNHIDLVKRGSATTTPGKVGNALTLNHLTNDFAETDFIPLNNQSFSVSFWLKPPTNPPGDRTLISQCETSGNYCVRVRHQSSGRLLFGFDGIGNLETASSDYLISQNVWTHAAVTFDQTQNQRQIFVNGTKVIEDNENPPLTSYGATTIGATCWQGCYDQFNGQIDQVRVFNTPLSQTEIQNQIASDGGTSCYELDPYWYNNLGELQLLHRANGTFNDEFDSGYNGTAGGNVTNNQLGCTNTNEAYSFDGSGDYVKIANTNVNLRGNADFAFRAWFKTTQTTKGTIIERFSPTNQVSIYVNHVADKATFLMKGNGSACVINSTTSVNDGQWHHVVAVNKTANPKKMMLFVDGIKQGEITNYNCGTWGTQSTNGFTSIGGGKSTQNLSNPDTFWFNGQIDDIGVWWYDISENEASVLR